jgi:Flp pilus assembly protein TadG
MPAPGARRPRASRRDRGAATLELAVLTPAIILVTFAIVQAALTGYAHTLAQAAAHAGVTAGRSNQAAPGVGVARARTFLAAQAGDTLRDTLVSDAGSTPDAVRITVSGRSLSVIPGLPGFAVRVTAQAPRERFTTPGTP